MERIAIAASLSRTKFHRNFPVIKRDLDVVEVIVEVMMELRRSAKPWALPALPWQLAQAS